MEEHWPALVAAFNERHAAAAAKARNKCACRKCDALTGTMQGCYELQRPTGLDKTEKLPALCTRTRTVHVIMVTSALTARGLDRARVEKMDEMALVGMKAGMARFVAAARSAPAACGAAAKARPERKPYGLGSQVPPGARSAPAVQVSQGARTGGTAGQAGAPETPTKRRSRDEDTQAAKQTAETRAGDGAQAKPDSGAHLGVPDLGSPAKRRCSPASSPVTARGGGGSGGDGACLGANVNLGASPAGKGRQRRNVAAAAAAPVRRLVQQRLQLGPLTPAVRETRPEDGVPGGGKAAGPQGVQTPSAAEDPGRSEALGEPAGGGAGVVDLCTPSTGERGAGSPAGLGSGRAPRSGSSIVDLTQDDDD